MEIVGYPLKAGHPLEGSCQEVNHPPYTPIRIKAHDGHLALWPGIRPLARIVPQKTLGTLPRPIVMITVHVALP